MVKFGTVGAPSRAPIARLHEILDSRSPLAAPWWLGTGLLACAAATPVAAPDLPEILRVAVVQYEIRGDASAGEVISRVEARLREAAKLGAELVVFPELFVLDAWPIGSEASESEITRSIAKDTSPRVWAAIDRFARKENIAVLAGSMPWLEDGALFNRAHLVLSDGRILMQDKVYPTPWGRTVGMTSGGRIVVHETPWGRIAILICYDAEFPDLSASLVEPAPEILLVPSMTESRAGLHRVRWSAQARAVEHHAFVVVASTVGEPTEDRRHFGRSAVLTPRTPGFSGLLAEADQGRSGIVFADLDLAALRDSRESSGFYPARDARRVSAESNGSGSVPDRRSVDVSVVSGPAVPVPARASPTRDGNLKPVRRRPPEPSRAAIAQCFTPRCLDAPSVFDPHHSTASEVHSVQRGAASGAVLVGGTADGGQGAQFQVAEGVGGRPLHGSQPASDPGGA